MFIGRTSIYTQTSYKSLEVTWIDYPTPTDSQEYELSLPDNPVIYKRCLATYKQDCHFVYSDINKDTDELILTIDGNNIKHKIKILFHDIKSKS